MKPENLMVVKGDSPEDLLIKLTDFGFACQSEEDMDLCLGTPEFMAPELANRTEYDTHVDVWSTGIITYKILTGRVPFKDENGLKELRR